MGLDWIAAAFEIFGLWLIGNKKRQGFLSCLICSVLWAIVAYQTKLYGLLIIAVLCFGTHIRNYRKWTGEKEDSAMDKEVIHEYFGLSYANYLVIPRVVLQSMPNWWQEQFVGLLDQIPETIDEVIEPEGGYDVQARDGEGRFVEDPLSNYERGGRRLKLKTKKS